MKRWAYDQQVAFKAGKLKDYKLKKLEILVSTGKFSWITRKWSAVGWDGYIKRLNDFELENGHCNVPVTMPG